MDRPIVSICCLTYNHAPFIQKALDGFLMQEPPTGVSADDPWYEILIHDDASTDGTDTIIREYAAKYPDKIFPLYETENQYQKVGTTGIDFFNYNRAKGKYIAYCEGDDYWTDAKKLQKQIDFMESHPEYSICTHGCSIYDMGKKNQYPSRDFTVFNQSSNKILDGTDFSVKDFFENHYGQPLTMLFRMSMFDFGWRSRYKYYRDTHEIYHLLKAGKGYWMNFNGGVYNVHTGGISGGLTRLKYCEISLPIDREFYWKTFDPVAKKQYIDTLETCVKEYSSLRPIKALRYAIRIFFLTGHPRSIIRNLKAIMGGRRKVES